MSIQTFGTSKLGTCLLSQALMDSFREKSNYDG